MFYKWVLLTSVAKGGKFRAYGMNFFCITNLPLASTRWIRSTIELFQALSSHTKQSTAVDKSLQHQEIRISPKKSWKRRESNPRLAGWEALCYADHHSSQEDFFTSLRLTCRKKMQNRYLLFSHEPEKTETEKNWNIWKTRRKKLCCFYAFVFLYHRKKVTKRQKCGFAVFVKFLVAGKGDLCVEKKSHSYESVRTSVCL